MEGKNKIAVQSGLLRLFPLELAVNKICEAGYDGIEIWGGQFHGYILDLMKSIDGKFELDISRVQAIKDICDRAGLPIACYTPEQLIYPINYLSKDLEPFDTDAVRERSRTLVHRCIDVAKLLGCGRMVLVTQFWEWRKVGGRYIRVSKADVLEENICEIEKFVHYAEKQGVTILIEPLVYHDSNGIVTLEDVQILMERVTSPNLMLMLDTGHIQVTAFKQGQEPLQYLKKHLDLYANRLGYFHIDDNPGKVDSHIAPGEGVINFKGMFNLLDEYGYKGWVSIELGILGDYALPENAESLLIQSKQFLDRLLH